MKKLQQLSAPIVLTLLLSVSTFAGDGIILIGKTDPPPPSPPTAVATSNEAEAECVTDMSAANDSVTEVALSMLQSVLALF